MSTIGVFASDTVSREDLVKLANNEIKTLGILSYDYFEMYNFAPTPKPLSNSPYLLDERNLIVYGEPFEFDSVTGRNRYLGYTMEDTFFTNYLFRNDVTSTIGLWNRNWLPSPKHDSKTKGRTEVQSIDVFNDNPLYEESIRLGLKLISRKKPDGSLLDFPEDRIKEREWHKYVHVYQPPTSVSWGCGIMFHNPSGNQVYYLTVPMSPEGLKSESKFGDLNVELEELPSSVASGDKVQVLIQIKSTYKTDLTEVDENAPFYKWEITDKTTNKPLPSVKYYGYAEKDTGNIEILANGETAILAEFEMPENDVNVKFEINKDGTNPEEPLLDNNTLETVIKPATAINTSGKFDLDYNVLSRKVKFLLADGKDITAKLAAPRGSLYGNAWGDLSINNKTTDLYRNFSPTNQAVDEAAGTIVKHPVINTTVYRKDATYDSTTSRYDNPIDSKWLDGPVSKTASGKITFGGTAYGNYKYTVTRIYEDGSTYTEAKSNKTSAAFSSGTDTRTITTHIYNGKHTIPAKTFENKIEYNAAKYLQKNLFWTSETYKFDVIRWMCHQDVDASLYGWTAVPGRYQRTFTQQNSGVLKWTPTSIMAKDYKRSREAARNGDYRKTEYDKAVFASDIGLKNVDYPIKSGYYFNPTGTYTFTVETVTYKTTDAETKDHKDLVDAVIDSFRYESDLMYINNRKEPVNIQNELLPKSGSSFARKPAVLTAKDPTGVDGVVMLKVEKSLHKPDVEEIKHSQDSGGFTHEYLKQILEGYDESGTIGSKNNYKYREYIKDGQNLYKITEKTTVTIKVNPENIKVYTNIDMPDGKYRVAAWIGDIALSDSTNAYKGLGTLKGIYNLDVIEVTVNGTLYDDQNAVIGN